MRQKGIVIDTNKDHGLCEHAVVALARCQGRQYILGDPFNSFINLPDVIFFLELVER